MRSTEPKQAPSSSSSIDFFGFDRKEEIVPDMSILNKETKPSPFVDLELEKFEKFCYFSKIFNPEILQRARRERRDAPVADVQSCERRRDADGAQCAT